jgi:type I restriction enzyme S subunit
VPAVIVEDIEGLVCGYHLGLIRPKASMHPTFLAKQLASAPTIKYFAANATGSTRFGLAIGTIEKLDIPTPPILEQSKIAEVLSTVDRAIEQTEALIAKQQRIKTGLMQDLLTRGIDEHGNLRSEQTHEFKDSQLGRIPVEWDPMPLGSCGQWFSGGTPSKAIPRFWDGGVPWVCPKDMKQFELLQSIDTITEDAVAAGARLMPTGTVFIVIRGMILAHTFPVGVSTTEVAFNQDVKAIVPKQGLMGRYLAYWLSSHSYQFLKLATTATHGTKRFDLDELQAASVGVPPPEEQKQIVRLFDEQQSSIERLQGVTAKLQAEKRGLMQDLLSGDRRVTALLGSANRAVVA